jgi:hypothetical protein
MVARGATSVDNQWMRPPPRTSSSVALVVGGWLVSAVLCVPLSLVAGVALADLLAPATGRASGDTTWFTLAVSISLIWTVVATAGWSWAWSRTRHRPGH